MIGTIVHWSEKWKPFSQQKNLTVTSVLVHNGLYLGTENDSHCKIMVPSLIPFFSKSFPPERPWLSSPGRAKESHPIFLHETGLLSVWKIYTYLWQWPMIDGLCNVPCRMLTSGATGGSPHFIGNYLASLNPVKFPLEEYCSSSEFPPAFTPAPQLRQELQQLSSEFQHQFTKF
jgi:hypothetical protein